MDRLLDLKGFCNSQINNRLINSLLLDESEWEYVSELVKTLHIFNIQTLKLQREQCTLSDFFGYWTKIVLKLSKKDDAFSIDLLNKMNYWRDRLLENAAMLGAIYLDPRYQRGLTAEQKNTAISFLKTLFSKIMAVEREEQNGNGGISNIDQQNDSNESDLSLEMEQFLDAISGEHAAPSITHPTMNNAINIDKILREFDHQREPHNISVLEFWEKNKSIHPILYKLSSTVYTIPPTQTSVERNFSAFALVLTSLRTRLGDAILENILIIKTNKEIFNTE